MTLQSRLTRLEERHAPENGEPQYFIIRIVRRSLDGELISEKRFRYLSTPGGLVRVEEPDAPEDAP